MARHVNTQYTMFKRNLQNRFADRYRENKNIEYTEQDKSHLKLIIPDIPEPIIPKANKFRTFSNKRKTESGKSPALSSFEQEYKNFVINLRKNKEKNIEVKEEEIKNETNITENKPTTDIKSENNTTVVNPQNTTNKPKFEKEYENFILTLRKNKINNESNNEQNIEEKTSETNDTNTETAVRKSLRHYRRSSILQPTNNEPDSNIKSEENT